MARFAINPQSQLILDLILIEGKKRCASERGSRQIRLAWQGWLCCLASKSYTTAWDPGEWHSLPWASQIWIIAARSCYAAPSLRLTAIIQWEEVLGITELDLDITELDHCSEVLRCGTFNETWSHYPVGRGPGHHRARSGHHRAGSLQRGPAMRHFQ
ncbi:hypothetical protein NDU88_000655 [Pleurodeles waltl]|uniref:Uncharacterized protein n=1 Tax=Pleurodeles waltl TaxID=8319 RepID=A0AAV7RAN8_PLEWA|nr:hypothetical protein NDU88_000655 [Pleurodeles waltl]